MLSNAFIINYYQVSYVILCKNVTHLNLSCLIYQNKGFGLEDLRSILSYDCLILRHFSLIYTDKNVSKDNSMADC